MKIVKKTLSGGKKQYNHRNAFKKVRKETVNFPKDFYKISVKLLVQFGTFWVQNVFFDEIST